MRLLCDDAARLCWLVLREAAAAESEAACTSLHALALSLLLVEIQRFRPTCSSSLSPCNHVQSCMFGLSGHCPLQLMHSHLYKALSSTL